MAWTSTPALPTLSKNAHPRACSTNGVAAAGAAAVLKGDLSLCWRHEELQADRVPDRYKQMWSAAFLKFLRTWMIVVEKGLQRANMHIGRVNLSERLDSGS